MKKSYVPVHLGPVSFPSKLVRVTDPCYDTDTWCSGELTLEHVVWQAWVVLSDEDAWGTRPAQLVLRSDEKAPAFWEKDWGKDMGIDVGVDSGQAGFFDVAHFKRDADVPYDQVEAAKNYDNGDHGDLWYGLCCNTTLNEGASAGLVPHGVVSSSGFGDGSYRCYVKKGPDGATTIRIVFIGDNSYTEEYVETLKKPKSVRTKKKAVSRRK